MSVPYFSTASYLINSDISHASTFTQTLLVALIFMLVGYYIQYKWQHRRLYELAEKLDGPKPWPIIGNALMFSGDQKDLMKKMLYIINTWKTPSRFWFGPKLYIVISKPEHMEVILTKALEKDEFYRYARPWIGTGLFSAPLYKWKKHRKIIMPTFNQKILDTFVPVFREQSGILLRRLEKMCNREQFDIFPYISACTLDIICETALGVTVRAQDGDSKYIRCASRAMDIMYQRMLKLWYHFDFIFNLTPLAKEERECLDYLHKFTDSVIKQHREEYKKLEKINSTEVINSDNDSQISKRKPFLQLLMESTDFTDQEIREEVDTMTIAGNDTTATVNSFCLLMMAIHQDVQEKVYNEIYEIFGDSTRPIEVSDLPKLKYLEMVIKETMRLYPVGPLIARTASEDIKMGEYVLPKGSALALAIIHTHRNPETWKEPERFDPERFRPEEVAKRHPYSYIPFSGGPRNCLGVKFAYMSMKTLLSNFLRTYKLTTGIKMEDIELKAELIIKPSTGFRINLQKR